MSREKHACVDLTEVSPFVGLGVKTFTVGHTALKVASSKVVKHEKVFCNNPFFARFIFNCFYM